MKSLRAKGERIYANMNDISEDIETVKTCLVKPCTICFIPISCGHLGVECNECKSEIHLKCIDTFGNNLDPLQHSVSSFICPRCVARDIHDSNISSKISTTHVSKAYERSYQQSKGDSLDKRADEKGKRLYNVDADSFLLQGELNQTISCDNGKRKKEKVNPSINLRGNKDLPQKIIPSPSPRSAKETKWLHSKEEIKENGYIISKKARKEPLKILPNKCSALHNEQNYAAEMNSSLSTCNKAQCKKCSRQLFHLDIEQHSCMNATASETSQMKKCKSMIESFKTSEITLNFELENLRGKVNSLQNSNAILQNMVSGSEFIETDTPMECDIIVLHDPLLKRIKTDLFQSQQLVMKKIQCARLDDALLCLQTYQHTAEVVVVHTGTSDLPVLSLMNMYDIVTDIHTLVTNSGSKLIFSSICEDFDDPKLVAKAQNFNKMIKNRLNMYRNVTMCQMSTVDRPLIRKSSSDRNRNLTKNDSNSVELGGLFTPYGQPKSKSKSEFDQYCSYDDSFDNQSS